MFRRRPIVDGPRPRDLGRRGFSRYRNADSYILTKLRYDWPGPSRDREEHRGELLSWRACWSKVFATDPGASAGFT